MAFPFLHGHTPSCFSTISYNSFKIKYLGFRFEFGILLAFLFSKIENNGNINDSFLTGSWINLFLAVF